MTTFKDITVVAIHGNGGIANLIPALEKSAAALPGCKTLLISDVMIDTPHEIKLLHAPMGYDSYSHFMVYSLHQYIDTEFVLTVQDDGWVLNADNWRDEWFNYDYIGGATHAALEGNLYKKNYTWINEFKNPLIVQNGGFSLRSKHFLEAPSKYGIMMVPQRQFELDNEDIQLCCMMRPFLEKVGIKFAPLEESILFSFEHLSPDMHKDLDLHKVFGHHSRFRRLVSGNNMNWFMTPEQLAGVPWEDKVLELFKHYGYEICHMPAK